MSQKSTEQDLDVATQTLPANNDAIFKKKLDDSSKPSIVSRFKRRLKAAWIKTAQTPQSVRAYLTPRKGEPVSNTKLTLMLLSKINVHFFREVFCGAILGFLALATQNLKTTKFATLAYDFGDGFLHHYNTFPLALFYLALIFTMVALLGNKQIAFFSRKIIVEPLQSFIFHTSSITFGALVISKCFNHFPEFGLPAWAVLGFIYSLSIGFAVIVHSLEDAARELDNNEFSDGGHPLGKRVAAGALTILALAVGVLTTYLLAQM